MTSCKHIHGPEIIAQPMSVFDISREFSRFLLFFAPMSIFDIGIIFKRDFANHSTYVETLHRSNLFLDDYYNWHMQYLCRFST